MMGIITQNEVKHHALFRNVRKGMRWIQKTSVGKTLLAMVIYKKKQEDTMSNVLQEESLKNNKSTIIGEFKIHETDTGSSQVQIAILTKRINDLVSHLKAHKKDNHSRRGLLNLVSRRRRLLTYLRRHNYDEYIRVSKELDLKIAT
jgi:small subunit ribosomal protein S15